MRSGARSETRHQWLPEAAIYDEAAADEPLYEDPVLIHADGRLELEGNRPPSPAAVHHVDVNDDVDRSPP
ncbi:hypothetical protein EA472_19565 [Natrarchaeobius oligotrophus]|uniref:Uncharacterized protein n=1 Tax=Natrarchaeobius chitinivorans TaxID=1679083 RepID=A0A3N6M257_NATCH|nr:hypothetical protein EA472_19565 [Natrarchaeobius chitinivorans]